MPDRRYASFAEAVRKPEEEIDLGRAALGIAQGEYPGLDIEAEIGKINRLSSAVADLCCSEADAYRVLASLNYVLFRREGFRGDRDDYYDPKNSFLNDVLERKKGIPITLSVLYMEVARRVGLTLEGVGFPGHFLVKSSADEEIIIDPFDEGEIRSVEELKRLLDQMYGGKIGFQSEFLAPLGKRQILKRMLNNLKMIYMNRSEPLKCLSVVERLLILDPGSAQEIRDRGLLSLKLERFGQAVADFETYLKLVPDAPDADDIRRHLDAVRKQLPVLH
jgi:regulator of sirC expression with transglutaminase-like and TPR domain